MSYEFYNKSGEVVFSHLTPMLSIVSKEPISYLNYWRKYIKDEILAYPVYDVNVFSAVGRNYSYSLSQEDGVPPASSPGFEFYSEEGVRLLSSSSPVPNIVEVTSISGTETHKVNIPRGKEYAIFTLGITSTIRVAPAGVGGWFVIYIYWEPKFTRDYIELNPVEINRRVVFTANPPATTDGSHTFAILDVTGV